MSRLPFPHHGRRRRAAPRGFALLSTVALMLFVFGVSMSVITYSLTSRRAARFVTGQFDATQVADAGLQHAIHCLKQSSAATECGVTYGTGYVGQTDVDIDFGTFTSTVTGTGSARDVTVTGTSLNGESVTIAATVTTQPPLGDVSFGYALQSGEGGVYLENNASIAGTIYSGGDVDCQSAQAEIGGDAYVSLVGGKIDSCTVGVDAYADSILDSDVGGDVSYATSASGTSFGGFEFTNAATPDAVALPDVDLDFWMASAEYGGVISGDYAPADGESLGPVKIVGDLTLGQNVDITVTGPIWVTGTITSNNNSSFTLDSSFGPYGTVILAHDPDDQANGGVIDIVNNTSITGSGQSTSHIAFVATNTSHSDAAPALQVANNATGAVFYAPNGVLRLANNATAKALAGYRLYADQNAVVTYSESDLVDADFSNSPPGTWRLLSGTWREVK